MAATTKAKRAHKALTVDQKLKLLDQIGKKSYTELCKEYGIWQSTITDIKKRKSSLQQYKQKMTEMGVKHSAKVMKLGKDKELEMVVFLWFKQNRKEWISITGSILRAKARELRIVKAIGEARGDRVDQEFTASSGWMWRFCKHHTIRQLSLQGGKLSVGKPAADQFIPDFQGFIEDGGYSLNQVFNCDTTGLYYKLLLETSLATHFEKSADGRKTQKMERVTIKVCSNVKGNIKLPLLLIGKSKNASSMLAMITCL